MKPSFSQKNFFVRSMSQQNLKNSPSTTYSTTFLNNKNFIFKEKKIKEIISFNDSDTLRSYFKNTIDSTRVNNICLKSRTKFISKESKKLPDIKRTMPKKVKSFSGENYNLQKEIIKTLNEKKNFNNLIGINYGEHSSHSSRDDDKEDDQENLASISSSSKKQLNLKSLDILNKFGYNQAYKDILEYLNLPKDTIIDNVYDSINTKNLNKNKILKSLNLSKDTNKDTKRNIVYHRVSEHINNIKKGHFEQKMDPEHFMKNQDDWREINLKLCFPYFMNDPNLLFKIMEKNSDKLKENNKLK